MLRKIFQKRFYAALAAALVLSACPGVNDTGEETGPQTTTEGNAKIIKGLVATGDPVLFYSLTTGERVSDPAGMGWDIAFAGGRQIWTNSGYTASYYKSGGRGAVWHTDKKVFAETVKDDAVQNDPFYKTYNEDARRYASGMSGGAELGLLARSLNVMTYAGYTNENVEGAGLSEDRFYESPYKYNKKQFYYNAVFMPPDFRPTMQVYIIRHGDGVHYSKLQITEYVNLPDTLTIKFENLPE